MSDQMSQMIERLGELVKQALSLSEGERKNTEKLFLMLERAFSMLEEKQRMEHAKDQLKEKVLDQISRFVPFVMDQIFKPDSPRVLD